MNVYRWLELIAVAALLAALAHRAWNVTTPSLTPRVVTAARVDRGSLLEIDYEFMMGRELARRDKPVNVLVGFVDPSGTRRLTDHHLLPISIENWEPNRHYRYTRIALVPEDIPIGRYTIELSLAEIGGKGERIRLEADELNKRRYAVGHLTVRADTSRRTSYESGWYEWETDPNDRSKRWRWTEERAVARLPNPGAKAVLYLRAESPRNHLPVPQTLTLSIGGHVVDRFAIEEPDPFIKRYVLDKESLSDERTIGLQLDVDRTFVPADDGRSNDRRRLGLRVYWIHLTAARKEP